MTAHSNASSLWASLFGRLAAAQERTRSSRASSTRRAQSWSVDILELRELARGIHPQRGPMAAPRPSATSPIGRQFRPPSKWTSAAAGGDRDDCYFIVAEALTNVMRHAAATGVTIRGEVRADGLHLEIRMTVRAASICSAAAPGSGACKMRSA